MSDVTPEPPPASDADRRYEPDVSPFQARGRAPLLRRTFPISANLSGYPKRSARRDVVAGLTIAALALPSGMAYAELAGLSPVVGLYALLLPAIAYTILGSSRQLIVGPEGALALLVATAVTPLAAGDPSRYAALAAMLAVLVGAISVIARVIRLGWVADYFSRAVLVGYLHGIVIVLIAGQLGKLFGLSISASEPIPQVREFLEEITGAHALTVAVAAVSLAVVLILRWRAPRVPGPLVVVLGGIAFSSAFGLADHGVAVVGHIPPGLPNIVWPSVGAEDVTKLLPSALGMFAVAYADGILTARSFAGRNGQHVDANQELLALGAANLAAGVTQGFSVGASGSRTAVNDQVGGRTQLVGLVSAAVIAVVLLVLTAPVEKLPTACLGSVIVAAAIGIVEPDAWRALARAGRSQVVIAVTTLAGVVVVGVLEALVVAVALSILDVVTRSARPHDAVLGYVDRLGRWANISLHPSARVEPGIVVYRLDDRLFFANARYFKGRVREAIAGAPTPTRYLVFDAEGLTGIDASGVEAVEQLVDTCRRDDIAFIVARLKSPIEDQFTATNLTDKIGAEHYVPTVQAPIDWCHAHAGKDAT
jgi:high affinity sulfate transporter 1